MPETTITTKLESLDDGVSVIDERPIAVKIDHVTMEFNMASEKLGSLKEYAIALAKGKLFFESFIALDDITFDVKKGDVYGILGTNGSGKSTLLKIIAGVLNPTKGDVEVNGNIAPLIELGAGFDVELSARENIFLNGALLGYSRSFIQEHFDAIVEFAEIEKFLDMPMKNFSSGMISRIAFAIATVIVPDILIVDEVLAVGDFMFQKKCEDRIVELIEKHGVTVLFVSHSNEQIERLCNKAIWIEKGHVRIMGDTSRVCNAYRALGGRTGTEESEKVVVRALKRAESDEARPIDFITIGGTDASAVNSNTALYGWNSESCDAAILVPYQSHCYTVSTAGIAGGLNAPVLPHGPDNVDPFTAACLRALEPSTIYVVATDEEFVSVAKDLKSKNILGEPINISRSKDLATNECNMLNFGFANHLLNPKAALVCSFEDVYASYTVAPLAYKNQIPFIIIEKGVEEFSDEQVAALKVHGVESFIVIGALCNTAIVKQIKTMGGTVMRCEDPVGAKLPALPVLSPLNKPELCVASGSLQHWMELRGAPALCGKLGIPIIFEKETNLQSKAECIDYVIESKPEGLVFLTSSSISEIDKKMLACSAS